MEILVDMMPNMTLLDERIFKDELKVIVDEVSKLHGWGKFAGTSGNLSGKEGDLDDLSSQVRQILMDEEKKKEERESGKRLQETLHLDEMGVLTGKITQASKKQRLEQAAKEKAGKRKGSNGSEGLEGGEAAGGSSTTSPGSLSSLSASTPLSELQALDHYLATGRMPKAPSKGAKVSDVPIPVATPPTCH